MMLFPRKHVDAPEFFTRLSNWSAAYGKQAKQIRYAIPFGCSRFAVIVIWRTNERGVADGG